MRRRAGAPAGRPSEPVRARREPDFEISVDGVPVPVTPGQTIGAALHGAGIRAWRTTRIGGRPRGLFCAIGVCFDCLVTVNGTPSLRACLTEARPGDRVSAGGAVPATDGPESPGGPGGALGGREPGRPREPEAPEAPGSLGETAGGSGR